MDKLERASWALLVIILMAATAASVFGRVTPHKGHDNEPPYHPKGRDFIHERADFGKETKPLPVTPLSLGDKQQLFSQLVAKLLIRAKELGYEVTLGEAWRSQATATEIKRWYADHGKGIPNSLHIQRLAIDINLFKDGKYLTSTSDYKELGDWWVQQHRLARWGGNFVHLVDGNHFSLEHEGVQ